MLFKYSVLFISGLTLCLMIITAAAQTPDEDRDAVRADQQTLEEDYRQLRQDQSVGNAAGIEIDEDNIAAAEQDFQADIKKAIADDQKEISADQLAIDALNQRLRHDMRENPDAVAPDQNDIVAAQQKLQSDSAQIIADDALQVTRDQQALDNENSQLQRDLRGSDYAVGGVDAVRADKQNIDQTRATLQEAQLKLQLDRNFH